MNICDNLVSVKHRSDKAQGIPIFGKDPSKESMVLEPVILVVVS